MLGSRIAKENGTVSFVVYFVFSVTFIFKAWDDKSLILIEKFTIQWYTAFSESLTIFKFSSQSLYKTLWLLESITEKRTLSSQSSETLNPIVTFF